ncbi:hypothetical protein ISR94_01490 [Candidatus Microgenomates bacterium]|nr:hypothetical protein [Candidatus Microgenomates bacterium]
MIKLSQSENKKIIHIRPNGAQGGGFGAEFENELQFKKFDKAIGEIPKNQRTQIASLRMVAEKVGVKVIDS